MKSEKVRQVISLYRSKFIELDVEQKDYSHDDVLVCTNDALPHCYGMLDKMEGFIDEGRLDKVYRWLGFVQGVLWAEGIYTLTELMNHNTKDS